MTKEERKEYDRRRYQAKREKILEHNKQYRKENAEKLKKYYQDNAEQIKERKKQYYRDNAERFKEQAKQYRQDNAEHYKEYKKQYYRTPIGRASHLLGAYNQMDRKANRGQGDLTAKWIVERIFSQPCAHCGKEGWDVIGCNRLDNSLPHTMDNVEPCCLECNIKLPKK